MKRSYPMHCLFLSNVGDVKLVPFISDITNIMRILGHNIFYTKLKINSMSITTGNVQYIMTEKDHNCRYQECDFHLSIPLLNLVVLLVTQYAMQGIFCRFK